MNEIKELIEAKIKHYLEILARAKVELMVSKKIEDPKERILKGMDALPATKEKILLSRKIIDDLNELKEKLK